jgi:hypothetical protein
MIINNESYAVGIFTFSKRKEYLAELVNDIRKDNDTIPIYLAVNCDYNPSFYLKFRGTSKIWNDIIVNTAHDNVFVLNDDVRIKSGFFDEIINHKISTNNNSILKFDKTWCGFLVNRNFMKSAGFFNERYQGIGFEDTEFVRRHGDYPFLMTDKFVNLYDEAMDTFPTMENNQNSWRKVNVNTIINKTQVVEKQYCSYNRQLFNSGEIADRSVNFRPWETFYDNDFDKIFGGR